MRIHLLSGKVNLETSATVPNPSEDAAWLAAAVPAEGSRYFEAGLGTGAASFCVLARLPQAHIIGLELQPEMMAAATHNLTFNPMAQNRLEIIAGDIATYTAPEAFEHSFANLPYYQPQAGFKSHHPVRDKAHGLGTTTLTDWLNGLKRNTSPTGTITCIGHIKQRDEFCHFFKDAGLHIIELRTHATRPAKRAIMQARLGEPAIRHHYIAENFNQTLRQAILQQAESLFDHLEHKKI
jgi:tRNA1(Val) A37 N6-methylase TrmN6